MSVRYINDRFLPDKAIDLMDEACSRIKMGDIPEDFAEELGCVLSTVGRWENGTRLPDVAMLMRIANLLGVTLSDLVE